MYLAQIIPDPNKLMDASNSLIVDQGIAIFAVVVFAIVIFGMMGQMFMMLRQSGRMLTQMGKESTQNDLDRAAAQRNTDELIDVKEVLNKLVDLQTTGNNNKHSVIKDGIKSVEENTESVQTMNGKLEDLEKAVREMLQKVNEGQRNFETFQKLTEKLGKDMELVLERLDELAKEQDAPTEPTAVIIDPGEAGIGKLKTVGKPSIGITPTSSATYPDKIEEETTS
ncbi:hypothetical protein LCGC14_3151170 [marine sediment metagenome]|uniref:Uncharacterized protein n=1 Tax=marine sediment metagenome TaxID=412755 RepID=A0A0F8VU30_9ZZZZ